MKMLVHYNACRHVPHAVPGSSHVMTVDENVGRRMRCLFGHVVGGTSVEPVVVSIGRGLRVTPGRLSHCVLLTCVIVSCVLLQKMGIEGPI